MQNIGRLGVWYTPDYLSQKETIDLAIGMYKLPLFNEVISDTDKAPDREITKSAFWISAKGSSKKSLTTSKSNLFFKYVLITSSDEPSPAWWTTLSLWLTLFKALGMKSLR